MQEATSMRVDALVPIRLRSAANLREHWAAKAARVRRERATVRLAAHNAVQQLEHLLPPRRAVVTITRRAPRLLDDDNLAGGAKGVRDELAAMLGVDDGPRGPVSWVYRQERAAGYAVAITIEVER